MKKSTILLLVIVYVVAFFAIALFGHSIRGYTVEIEPESIEVIDPDEQTTLKKDVIDEDTGEKLYDYYFLFKNYTSANKMRIKAIVNPANTNYPNVKFSKDERNEVFDLLTHENNPEIEENFCEIVLKNELDSLEVVSAPFLVISTNPGVQITIKACVTFVGAFQLLHLICVCVYYQASHCAFYI